MLPCRSAHERVVLVRRAFDDELAGLVDAEPGPAAAEAGDRRFGEGFFEFVEAPEVALDRFGQRALGLPPPLPMIVQNIEWLAWPPPLLRTAVRMSSGTFSRLATGFDRLVGKVVAFESRVQIVT